MDERDTMGWKTFSIRLIEALRWPAAFVATMVIFREPIGGFIRWIARAGLG